MTDERSDDEPDVTERVEDIARAAATLAARGGELVAATHEDDVRRAARSTAVPATAAVALLTGFAFANVAAERALNSSLSGWLHWFWPARGARSAWSPSRWSPAGSRGCG